MKNATIVSGKLGVNLGVSNLQLFWPLRFI